MIYLQQFTSPSRHWDERTGSRFFLAARLTPITELVLKVFGLRTSHTKSFIGHSIRNSRFTPITELVLKVFGLRISHTKCFIGHSIHYPRFIPITELVLKVFGLQISHTKFFIGHSIRNKVSVPKASINISAESRL